MLKYLLAVLLALSFLGAGLVYADKAVVCLHDARIMQDDVTNYGNDTFLYAGMDVTELNSRSVLTFIVYNSESGCPQDNDSTYTVDSVKLKIRGTSELNTTDRYIMIHLASRPFIESQVDWLDAENGVAWTTGGGDYYSSIKDSLNFTTPNTWYTVKLNSDMAESVEAAMRTQNWFYLEILNKSEATANSRKQFSSAEGGMPETLLIYGNSTAPCPPPVGQFSPLTPNATIIYDGGTNITSSAMEPPWRNMAVRTASGNLVMCWQNQNPAGDTIDGLVYSYSTDNGSTWAAPKQITPWLSARGSMVAVQDSIYILYSKANNGAINTDADSMKFCKITSLGSAPTGYTGLVRAGHHGNIGYQEGDTFWAAYARQSSGGAANKCTLYVDYSVNRGGSWTNSTAILIGSRNAANGENVILRNGSDRMIIVVCGTITGEGSIRATWRKDGDALTSWKAIQNVVNISFNGRWSHASLMPNGNDVIIHYVASNNDTSRVLRWLNADSSFTSITTVFSAFNWQAGKKLQKTQIGTAGDTIFAMIAGQNVGATNVSGTRTIQFKKSVDGTTWIDSTLFIESPEYRFDKVWRESVGTWIDYTTLADNDTTNDVDFFNTNNDTLFFGHSVKYDYICFVEGSAVADGAQTLTWRYWNGSTWATLTPTLSEPTQANFFTTVTNVTTHQIWFERPTDWVTTTVNGVADKYWIKLSTDAAYASLVQMTSLAPAIFQDWPHIVKPNPTTYMGMVYIRGALEAANSGDPMFAKYTITAGGAVAHNARRERLIR